jgi:hypothetical protein
LIAATSGFSGSDRIIAAGDPRVHEAVIKLLNS